MSGLLDISKNHDKNLEQWKKELPNHLSNIDPKDVEMFSAVVVEAPGHFEVHMDGSIKLPGFKKFYFSAILHGPPKK